MADCCIILGHMGWVPPLSTGSFGISHARPLPMAADVTSHCCFFRQSYGDGSPAASCKMGFTPTFGQATQERLTSAEALGRSS